LSRAVGVVGAYTGGALLRRQPSPTKPRLDIPGVLLAPVAVFCLVYGFSNAGTHGWSASTRLIGRQAVTEPALAHGYDTAFWWLAGIFAGGAVICGVLLRNGPLTADRTPSHAAGNPGQGEIAGIR
jgi:hypothetical protein